MSISNMPGCCCDIDPSPCENCDGAYPICLHIELFLIDNKAGDGDDCDEQLGLCCLGSCPENNHTYELKFNNNPFYTDECGWFGWDCNTLCHQYNCNILNLSAALLLEGGDYILYITNGRENWKKNFGTTKPVCSTWSALHVDIDATTLTEYDGCDYSASYAEVTASAVACPHDECDFHHPEFGYGCCCEVPDQLSIDLGAGGWTETVQTPNNECDETADLPCAPCTQYDPDRCIDAAGVWVVNTMAEGPSAECDDISGQAGVCDLLITGGFLGCCTIRVKVQMYSRSFCPERNNDVYSCAIYEKCLVETTPQECCDGPWTLNKVSEVHVNDVSDFCPSYGVNGPLNLAPCTGTLPATISVTGLFASGPCA